MSAAELARSDAWHAGWQYLNSGYFWEAHELFEPVWMVLPQGSSERMLVQAVIQLANARLKAQMGRARAVSRLCDLAQGLLEGGGYAGCGLMGLEPAGMRALLREARAGANPSHMGGV